jgi:hypothetical protein
MPLNRIENGNAVIGADLRNTSRLFPLVWFCTTHGLPKKSGPDISDVAGE